MNSKVRLIICNISFNSDFILFWFIEFIKYDINENRVVFECI